MKRTDHKIQAKIFRDYASKYPNRDFLSLFSEWVESKAIYGKDKHGIWKIARNYKSREIKTIRKNTDEFIRVSEVFNILLQADLTYLSKLIEKERKRKDLTKTDKRLQYRHAEKKSLQHSSDRGNARSP